MVNNSQVSSYCCLPLHDNVDLYDYICEFRAKGYVNWTYVIPIPLDQQKNVVIWTDR